MNKMNMTHMSNSSMDHARMNHSGMGGMDHAGMNHTGMGGMDHTGMNHNGSSGHGMAMYFNTDLPLYLIFQPIHVTSGLQLFGSCAIIFILAFLYEGLKTLREYLLHTRSTTCHDRYEVTGTPSDLPANGDTTINNSMTTHVFRPRLRRASWFDKWHLLQSGLHMVQVFISYVLMLLFMTYNVYVCIAVILGAGAGYFAFSRNRAAIIDINEHCH